MPTTAQLDNFQVRIDLVRQQVEDLKQSGQVNIPMFTYGKLMYEFNYAASRMKQAAQSADNVAAFGSAVKHCQIALHKLEELDSQSRITYSTPQAEVNFLRLLLAFTKLVGEF
jgi:hypothetical protein